MNEHERQTQMTALEAKTLALVDQVVSVVERAMALIVEMTIVLGSSAGDEARHEALTVQYRELHAETVRLHAAIKTATDTAKHLRGS